ncbi:MAG: DUF2066 domain-containing protein [Halioglobus sp.]
MSLLLMVASAPGFAVVVEDLYEAEVAVKDHSAQALSAASREALSEVLVKVSGSVAVLQNPAIGTALGEARSYVQQYSYTRDEDARGDLAARFEFDRSVVSRLVTEAGAPLWTANRPAVLVWIVAQDAKGRQFVSREVAPDVMMTLEQGFSQRGVPVRFPLFDLQDTASLAIDDAWRLQAAPIFNASERYGVQDILAGRLTGLSTGEWVGDWTYFSGRNRIDRSLTVDSVDSFLLEGVSLVAEQMAGRYAVAASGATAGGIAMTVAGVNSYGDYAKIVSWLEGLELIEHANIETIRGQEIELRLVARADAGQLKTIIELNKRLTPLEQVRGTDQLSYQWQN